MSHTFIGIVIFFGIHSFISQKYCTGYHDYHAVNMNLGDGEGQGGLLCCNPWGHKESDTIG